MSTVTLSTLRTRLRIFLDDSEGTNWTDDALDLFLNQAIVKYTTDLPAASGYVYTVADDAQGDNHTYLLPDNFADDHFVRGEFDSSEAENISRLNHQFGSWETADEPKGYMVDWPNEGYLYLPREPESATFTLYYGAFHDIELSSDSDTFDLGRNKWGEEAVYAYAAYLAFNPASSNRAMLEQWARKGDQKVDNPLEQEGRRWLERYRELIDEHAEVPVYWEFTRTGRA